MLRDKIYPCQDEANRIRLGFGDCSGTIELALPESGFVVDLVPLVRVGVGAHEALLFEIEFFADHLSGRKQQRRSFLGGSVVDSFRFFIV